MAGHSLDPADPSSSYQALTAPDIRESQVDKDGDAPRDDLGFSGAELAFFAAGDELATNTENREPHPTRHWRRLFRRA